MPSEKLVFSVVKELATVLALLGLGELALRAFAPEYGHKVFDNKYTGSYPINLNADKYRGPAVAVEKPPAEIRILALGDSETFGTGVAAGDTWPAQLERIANRSRSGSVVLNGALEGMSPGDISRAWTEKWAQYRPNVVVFGLNPWMVSLTASRQNPIGYDALAERYGEPPNSMAQLRLSAGRALHGIYTVGFASTVTQSALYWIGLLDHRVKKEFPYGSVIAYGWQQGDIPTDQSARAWSGFEREFVALSQQVHRSGARMILAWLPPRFDISNDCRDNAKNVPRERFTLDPVREAARVSQAAGAEFVNTLPRLKEERQQAAPGGKTPDLYIHFDVGHFDANGNRAVAEAIAVAL